MTDKTRQDNDQTWVQQKDAHLLFVFFGKMLAAESLDTEVGTTSFFLSTEPTCSAGLEVKKMDIGSDQKVGWPEKKPC